MIRIFHTRTKCIGCNACVEADKNRWRISRKDGKSFLIGGKEKKGVFHFIAGQEEFRNIRVAKQNCPVKIIRVQNLNRKSIDS